MRLKPLALLLPLVLLALTAARGAEEPQKAAAPVEVTLSEYKIEMPTTIQAGPTTFQVHNQGQKKHSFKIEGPGIEAMLSAVVGPKETGSLDVTLQAGEYKVYCPIGNHSMKGMTMKLVVTENQGR
ncbi:MAG TPA: cupredoxin domain-containing protein [Thermoanaerobaculia bacterium]|nr:cupredoxin domain-containing protein [Thermoanaerobaculia bacterium]